VLLARHWPLETGHPAAAIELGAGLAAVVGHVFPIFSRLRGGKGVATAAGALLAFAPGWLAVGGVAFFVLVRATHYVSVASMGSAMTLAVLSVLARFVGPWRPPWALTAYCAAATAIIVWAHRGNLARLAAGTEDKP